MAAECSSYARVCVCVCAGREEDKGIQERKIEHWAEMLNGGIQFS